MKPDILLGIAMAGLLGIGSGWGVYAFSKFIAVRLMPPRYASILACVCGSLLALTGVLILALPMSLYLLYRDFQKLPPRTS